MSYDLYIKLFLTTLSVYSIQTVSVVNKLNVDLFRSLLSRLGFSKTHTATLTTCRWNSCIQNEIKSVYTSKFSENSVIQYVKFFHCANLLHSFYYYSLWSYPWANHYVWRCQSGLLLVFKPEVLKTMLSSFSMLIKYLLIIICDTSYGAVQAKLMV